MINSRCPSKWWVVSKRRRPCTHVRAARLIGPMVREGAYMEASEYFTTKAAQCRRLAGDLLNRDDPAVVGLTELASEFEKKAAACAVAFRPDREESIVDVLRPSILLLDDDRHVCEVVARGLSEAGYKVTPVVSSMECLKLLADGQRFDLMIIDIRMPPANPHGLSLGLMVRSKRPAQKIIYITGFPEELLEGFIDGHTPVLAKPFRMNELLHTVARVLQQLPAT